MPKINQLLSTIIFYKSNKLYNIDCNIAEKNLSICNNNNNFSCVSTIYDHLMYDSTQTKFDGIR